MVSRKLVQTIERNADKLAIDLVETLRQDRRAEAYQDLTDAQYRTVVRDLYSNLGEWLESRTWNKLRSTYEQKGRERMHGGMPLEQLVYSLTKTKQLLLDFIRKSLPGDSSEADQELQLIVAVSDFFDRAIYHTVSGYEDARRTQASARSEEETKAPAAKAAASTHRVSSADAPSASEMQVSRAGDIGEHGG